jgi:hypothetical protein
MLDVVNLPSEFPTDSGIWKENIYKAGDFKERSLLSICCEVSSSKLAIFLHQTRINKVFLAPNNLILALVLTLPSHFLSFDNDPKN